MITRKNRLFIKTERAKEVVATIRDYLLHHERVPDFRHRDAREIADSGYEQIRSCIERYQAVGGDLGVDEFLAAERVMNLLEWLRGRVIAVQGRGRLQLVHADHENIRSAA